MHEFLLPLRPEGLPLLRNVKMKFTRSHEGETKSRGGGDALVGHVMIISIAFWDHFWIMWVSFLHSSGSDANRGSIHVQLLEFGIAYLCWIVLLSWSCVARSSFNVRNLYPCFLVQSCTVAFGFDSHTLCAKDKTATVHLMLYQSKK